jgi:hypothetical protein
MKTCTVIQKAIKVPRSVVLLTILISLRSCANFYKIHTTEQANITDTIQKLRVQKEFVIHLKDTVFILNNPSISGDQLFGKLEAVEPTKGRYLNPKSKDKNFYEKADEKSVLNQVHLYISLAYSAFSNEPDFSIPVSAITRADINLKNQAATSRSQIIGATITSVLVAGLFAAIIVSGVNNLNISGW